MNMKDIVAAGHAVGARLLRCKGTAKGLWKFVPLPKPTDFAFVFDDPTGAPDLFRSLDAHVVFDFIAPSSAIAPAVEDALSTSDYRRKLTFLQADESHFVYGVDTDDRSVDSGILEYLSIGRTGIDRVPELRVVPL